MPILVAVPSLGAGCAEVGVLEPPPGLSWAGVTRRGEERWLRFFMCSFLLLSPLCHTAMGNLGGDGEQRSKRGRRGCEDKLHLP